jgi:hypothetical protein
MRQRRRRDRLGVQRPAESAGGIHVAVDADDLIGRYDLGADPLGKGIDPLGVDVGNEHAPASASCSASRAPTTQERKSQNS